MKRILFLIPMMACASQPSRKYTTEQLKDLKPPLVAQQYSLHTKIHAKVISRIAPEVSATVPFSPRVAQKKLKKGSYRKVPFNSPVTPPTSPQNAPAFPEIVLAWEGSK